MGVAMGYVLGAFRQGGDDPDFLRQLVDVPFTADSAVGSAEWVAEIIQQYIDAGVSKFVVWPLYPGHETMKQLAIMGEAIVPVFDQDLSEAMP
jgi:alkanesulfonate monooxygenase SsuD/methylene tetrahydromethanopterin reductase-like flavin-dependent oxidoreductase (luciferase family)